MEGLAVIIAAAGSGSRMKAKNNKQYMLIAGQPLLRYCLEVFEQGALVQEIIIVARENEVEYCEEYIVRNQGYKKISKIIPGGAHRQDSVWAGLCQLEKHTGLVAVHDGARPFITLELLDKLLEAAKCWGAAVPGRLAVETVKRVDKDLFVEETLDRSALWTVQTPQIFSTQKLRKAYLKGAEEGYRATDDAALYERYIGRVKILPGEENNIKITTPEDIKRAEFILSMR